MGRGFTITHIGDIACAGNHRSNVIDQHCTAGMAFRDDFEHCVSHLRAPATLDDVRSP
jgi:hypothetical protein